MRVSASVFALLIVTGLAAGQSPDGKKISVEVQGGRFVPIQLPDGDAEAGEYVAKSPDGATVPVTSTGAGLWAVLPADAKAGRQQWTLSKADLPANPAVRVEKRADADALDVFVNGDLFTTYHYSNDDRKPYLWPIKAEGDVPVTRDWPMGERAESADHPHHVSFWTGYGDINGNDYWEYGERTGWQRTEAIEFGSGDACGWIRTHIVWEDKDHQPVMDEHRAYRFYATPASGRMFDVDIRFAAKYGEVKIGDTKEGGMVSVRVADGLRERGGTGEITNSEGIVGGSAAWGKPAAWCDYSGKIEGAGVRGIAVFDSPSSFRYPTHWHVRDYGLMGANPFGYSHFYNGAKNGNHTLEDGGTLSFSYRIYVHSGDVEKAVVAAHYADFANPPAVQ